MNLRAASLMKKLLKRGKALLERRDLLAAATQFDQLLQIKPNLPEALYYRGLIAYDQSDFGNACDLIMQSLDSGLAGRDIVTALFCVGTALHILGKNTEAISYLRRLLRLSHNHILGLRSLGLAYLGQRDYGEAVSCLKKASALQPNDPALQNDLGTAYFSGKNVDKAQACFKKALALQPDFILAHQNLGNAMVAAGRFDEAMEHFKTIIKMKPDETSAYRHYAQCKKITEQDFPLAEQAIALLKRHDLDADKRIDAFYFLGKCHDDLKDYDAAFRYYQEANRLERAMHPFDRNHYETGVSNLIKVFTKEFIDHHKGFGISSDVKPVLVVGVPRSGTTLVNQILSAHSKVGSAEECAFWVDKSAVLGKCANGPYLREEIDDLARQYLNCLRTLAPKKEYIVDKLPGNFFQLGLIHLCLPDVRIIHCKRNPVDSCLSIFFQRFTEVIRYSHDLDDLACYYRQYARIMSHWNAALPGRILEVQYEDLVRNQERETRRMLEFCNLHWEDACLTFQNNPHAVFSASNWQVRQPVFTGSVERWRNYEKHIGPLAALITAT